MSGNKTRQCETHTKIGQCRILKCRPPNSGRRFQSFADLVVIAKEFYPIPFRTRPSKPSASMVLRLKPRESRTLPGLPRAEVREPANTIQKAPVTKVAGAFCFSAGVASRPHPAKQFRKAPYASAREAFSFL